MVEMILTVKRNGACLLPLNQMMRYVLYKFLTASSHRGLRNCFFFVFYVTSTFSLFYLDFYFETFRDISRYFDHFSIFFQSFQSRSDFGFLPNFYIHESYLFLSSLLWTLSRSLVASSETVIRSWACLFNLHSVSTWRATKCAWKIILNYHLY